MSPGTLVTRSIVGILVPATTVSNLNVDDFVGSGFFDLVARGSSRPDGALGFNISGFHITPGPKLGLKSGTNLDATVQAKVTYEYAPAVAVPEPIWRVL